MEGEETDFEINRLLPCPILKEKGRKEAKEEWQILL